MAFFNAPFAALMLLSVVVVSSASSIAQVPSSSPSTSPRSGMSKEEEKALVAKMNATVNMIEVFISKDIEEWRNDPTSNSKICIERCEKMYVLALDSMRGAIPSVSDGNFRNAIISMSSFNPVITTCNDCFDEESEYSTSGVVIRPDSVGNISDWATGVATECLDTFAKYK